MSNVRCGNFMNWTGVSITPNGGQAINVTEVTDVSPMLGSTNEAFYGDNRRFAKLLRSTEYKRGVSITTGDAAAANAVPVDQPCTIVATLNDAKNGAGTGAITYTFKNCVMKQNGLKAGNNKFAETTLEFEAYGDDSSVVETDPFSFVVAS